MASIVAEVRTGRVRPLDGAGTMTGIFKSPRAGRVRLAATGLEGDEHGDTKHHGGAEKAVHHYAAEHYPTWREELPDCAELFRPGAFGENLSTLGMTEATVCVGDVYEIGTARVEVSQARQPCWRLNRRFGRNDMARRVQESLRPGWYYRVLEPGEIAAGDEIRLAARAYPSWTLARLLHHLYVDRLNREALAEIASLPALSPSWRDLAASRLARGAVEDWRRRLGEATAE